MGAKVEFLIGKKLFRSVSNPGTSRCPTAQLVIKFLTSRSFQFVGLLPTDWLTDWNLKKKRLKRANGGKTVS